LSADLKKPHGKPHFQVPAGACDCHMHVFGPRERYPYSRERTYTPRPAPLADYRKMAATIGLQRVIFVQPSAYGADNRCVIDGIREVGENARGVIVIDDSVGADELREMSRLGIRGVRINAASRGLREVGEISHLLQALHVASPRRNGTFRSSPTWTSSGGLWTPSAVCRCRSLSTISAWPTRRRAPIKRAFRRYATCWRRAAAG
jgi:Amidohydrolase